MSKNSSIFTGQTGQYPLSLTTCWKAIPDKATEAYLENQDVLQRDEKRAQDYQLLKPLVDKRHQVFIDQILAEIELDWQPLQDALQAYQKEKAKKKTQGTDEESAKKRDAQRAALKAVQENLFKIQAHFRKEIADRFTTDNEYKKLFGKELFTELLDKQVAELPPGEEREKYAAAVTNFKKYSVYFKGYHENRKNMYSEKEQTTALANRIVHENFPKFQDNQKIYKRLLNKINENEKKSKDILEKTLKPVLNRKKLDDIFSLNFFNQTLTQAGIDYYNQVLGGITDKNQKTKIQGINEIINQLNQNEKDKNKKIPFMESLFKQILAQRQTNSYVPRAFASDSELQDAIQNFYEQGLLRFSFAGQEFNILKHLAQLISQIKDCNPEQIYISASELPGISRALLGDWEAINNDLESYAQTQFIAKAGKNKGKPSEKQVNSWLKSREFSLADINAALSFNERDVVLESYWDNFPQDKAEQTKRIAFPKMAAHIDNLYKGLKKSVLKKIYPAHSPLGSDENQEDVIQIKDFLDAIQDFLHAVNPFVCSNDAAKDNNFYGNFLPFYQQLDLIIDLYNKTRNYLTQKAADGSKFKLTFDLPTLADGWDENKQQANGAIILRRNGLYYLAILNSEEKTKISDLSWKKGEPAYEKMVYKYLPGPNKMLPKVFFSAKRVKKYNPPQDILDGYDAGRHVKGKNFDIKFCSKLIDWFKKAIEKHPDWKQFGFHFSETKSYNDISEFYREISLQGYSLSFENVSAEQIDQWVKEGKLFWFQLYNKDFSPNSTGRKNLHTLYWLECFAPENLRNVVFKLNGEAELFLREKSARIKTPFVHRKGELMLNRRLKKPLVIDNKLNYTIPENLFGELYDYVNKRIRESELSKEALRYKPHISTKPVKHEITKDQRYTQRQFLFHVPITVNFKTDDNSSMKIFNKRVQDLLIKNKKEVQIIGLDRGETNLIYLTRLGSKREILEQKTFNVIKTDLGNNIEAVTDFQAKLTQRQEERKEARQSWKTIAQIKDLKAGYISQVVHEIVTMMIQHNAILVMEDLSFGFKQGRFKVEKQVYQKFEKALLDKLNYLVFKDRSSKEEGGVLNGYQLTPPVKQYKDIKRQCGFIFYVPAPYTSAIDPTTGYVNPLKIQYKNVEKAKAFIQKIDSIRFSEKNGFEFDFDFSKFKHNFPLFQKKWKVCTIPHKIRYRFNPKTKKTNSIIATDKLNTLFSNYHINVSENVELKDDILRQTEAEFFRELLFCLGMTMQLRNRAKANDQQENDQPKGDLLKDLDFILSPIERNGEFFDSEKYNKSGDISLPRDADANGAYHIALKGLWLLENNFPEDDWITKQTWFSYRQKNENDAQ